ncbi:unnamed protein product [Albugo candida]|uniref:Major facilitator superfamily (MFS) profile domain-containing protein n=1 Tax=Albugo candida TaxID=65357 RepID=A0A024GBA5_9STRA|nr:unnamed protein product [Albugo candida]|eukprot:CCI43617.1 unnamed protein product [Albugo candida]
MEKYERNLEAMPSHEMHARLRPLLALSFLQSFSWGITAPIISIAITQYYATQYQLPGQHIDCFHSAADRACVEGSKIASWYSSLLSALVCVLKTTANFTDSDIARHFLIHGISCILAQTFCLPLLMRFCGKEKGVVIISLFFYVLPCLTYALLVWYPYKWIVFAMDGVSGIQVLSHIAITSLFSISSPLQEQGRLQGAIVGVRAVFEATGPLLYAFMYSRMRVQQAWTRILPFLSAIILYSMAIGVACLLPSVMRLAVDRERNAVKQNTHRSLDTREVEQIVEPLLGDENTRDKADQ